MKIDRVSHRCGSQCRGWRHTNLRRKLDLFLMLVVSSSCLPSPLLGDEDGISLGRIEVRMNSTADSHPVGPVRLPCDAAMVFKEYLARERIGPDELTRNGVSAILAGRHLVLSRTGSPTLTIPAQWEPVLAEREHAVPEHGTIVWLIDNNTNQPPDGEYTLLLRDGKPRSEFSLENIADKQLIVKYSGKRVLRYNHAVVQQRHDRTGPYDRACYIHPVWTPSGSVVTGDFPPEHIHQRGIFTAWVRARFGDVETDFWGLGSSKGRVLPTDVPPQAIVGPVFTKLIISNKGVVENKTVFNEHVEITVYSGMHEKGWLFDIQTRQAPVSGGAPMELPKIYYGGTSFRGPATWLARTSRDVQRAIARGVSFEGAEWLESGVELDILTSEGNDRTSGDRTTTRWIDYTGPLGSRWGGLSMYDHRSNLRYPTPVRVHPELPYFSFAFVQKEPFTIAPEKPLKLVYRVLVHDGRPNASVNERVARSFCAPPKLTWRPL